ncbi:MAG: hypothetical protein U1F53_01475 [Burkholderiaceae bacterium]
MNTSRWQHLPTVLALAAALSAPVLAATSIGQPPAPQMYNHVKVVNGGVSLDEADAVKRIAPDYRLRVILSGRGGDYQVAQTLAVVQDGRVVARIPDAGPYVLMDLPAGHYTLEGQFAGLSMSRDVNVASAGTTVNWVLPPSLN